MVEATKADKADALQRALDCGCVENEPGSMIAPDTRMGKDRIAFHLAEVVSDRVWEESRGRIR